MFVACVPVFPFQCSPSCHVPHVPLFPPSSYVPVFPLFPCCPVPVFPAVFLIINPRGLFVAWAVPHVPHVPNVPLFPMSPSSPWNRGPRFGLHSSMVQPWRGTVAATVCRFIVRFANCRHTPNPTPPKRRMMEPNHNICLWCRMQL